MRLGTAKQTYFFRPLKHELGTSHPFRPIGFWGIPALKVVVLGKLRATMLFWAWDMPHPPPARSATVNVGIYP
jgi:hypothetical protein